MLTPDQTETITKYATSLKNRLEQELNDPEWIKERKTKRDLISGYLSKEKIGNLTKEKFGEIIKSLWAWQGWSETGIQSYILDAYLLKNNDMDKIKKSLYELLYGNETLEVRYDNCRKKIKGMAESNLTEILLFIDPEKYAIWNDKPKKVFPILGIKVPKKLTGSEYKKMIKTMKEIKDLLVSIGFSRIDFLGVDLFFWLLFKETGQIRKEQKKSKDKKTVEPQPISSASAQDMDHWKAIGMLVELGAVEGYETYVADPSKKYKDGTLGSIASTSKIPEVFANLKQIDKTDVIWFGLEPPFYFFEVEHKGTMRDALLRLYQARVLKSKLFIVSPIENRDKFEKWVNSDPFKSMQKLFRFKSWDELAVVYDTHIASSRIKNSFLGE